MTKLEQAKAFVFSLLQYIPKKNLNNKNVIIFQNDEVQGTLQEYINKNLKEIWGIEIVWED